MKLACVLFAAVSAQAVLFGGDIDSLQKYVKSSFPKRGQIISSAYKNNDAKMLYCLSQIEKNTVSKSDCVLKLSRLTDSKKLIYMIMLLDDDSDVGREGGVVSTQVASMLHRIVPLCYEFSWESFKSDKKVRERVQALYFEWYSRAIIASKLVFNSKYGVYQSSESDLDLDKHVEWFCRPKG